MSYEHVPAWHDQRRATVWRRIEIVNEVDVTQFSEQIVHGINSLREEGHNYDRIVIEATVDTIKEIREHHNLMWTFDSAHSTLVSKGYVGEWMGCRVAASDRNAVTIFFGMHTVYSEYDNGRNA